MPLMEPRSPWANTHGEKTSIPIIRIDLAEFGIGKLLSCGRFTSRSVPTGFLRIGRPHRLYRYEVLAIGHLYLWQTLRVHDVGLLDDAVHVEQIRGQGVDFVGF